MGYSYQNRRKLWAGTIERMQWWPTPLRGADSTPEGWVSEGVLLNGGGYVFRSWGSHKVYQYEWPESTSREDAQMIHNYYNGTYGRGLIYMLDPLTWTTNILPARWADPSLALEDEGAGLVYGLNPTPVVTSGSAGNNLPVQSAYYDLSTITTGFRGVEDALFIPIPEDHGLMLGAFYQSTGSGGLFVSPQNANGTIGSAIRLTELANDATTIAEWVTNDYPGVWLWAGKTSSGAASITVTAMIGRIGPTSELVTGDGFGLEPFGEDPFGGVTSTYAQLVRGPWVGGQGNSGLRFTTAPSFLSNSPLGGGQVGVAATFREVGSWA